jgi:hypothetical protein
MDKRYLGTFALLATCFGVFVLPFLLPPPPLQIISSANAAEFNNHIAIAVSILLAFVVLACAYRSGISVRLPEANDCGSMPRPFVLGWILAMTATVALYGSLAYLTDLHYATEANYFLQQLSKADAYKLRIYGDVEFGYGPLLFYPTLWLKSLFALTSRPLQAAYLFTLILHTIIGLSLLAYVMQRLPISLRLRKWTFPCLALLNVNYSAGLNYTYLRFTAPLASVLFCLQAKNTAMIAILAFAGEVLNLGISPEMGVAFSSGIICSGLIQLLRTRRLAWLAVIASPIAGATAFLSFESFHYLDTMRTFSAGADNMIVEPQLYVALLLISLVWVVPLAVVSFWRNKRTDALEVTALFATGVALVPAAFGRADIGHVVFNGLALFLLALIPIGAWKLRYQWVWIGAMLSMISLGQFTAIRANVGSYKEMAARLCLQLPVSIRREIIHLRPHTRLSSEQFAVDPMLASLDARRVRLITKGARVAAPADISLADKDALRRAGIYLPDYYAFPSNELSAQNEQREIEELHKAGWLLLKGGVFPLVSATVESERPAMGLPFPYSTKRRPFKFGASINADVVANWQPVAKINGYTLYRRSH